MLKISKFKSYVLICIMMCVMSGGIAYSKTLEKAILWNATTGHAHDGVNAGNTVPFTNLEGPINLEGASLYGDLISSGNLQLESTSHATKGSILFNSIAAIIEDPGELIVGKQTPCAPIIGGVTHRCRISSVDEGANLVGVCSWQHNDVGILGATMAGFRSRGTHVVPVIVNASDSLHGLIAAGFDGTDYEYAAMILFGVDGTPGNNDMPGNIIFKVTPDGGVTPAESFRIKNDKNVLMATTNQLQFRDTGIALTSEVDGSLSLVSDGTVNIASSVGGTPVFHVNNTTGNVGIGTTSFVPVATLQVGNSTSADNQYIVIDAPFIKQAALSLYSAGVQKIAIYRPNSSDDLRFWTASNSDSFVLKQSGNMGIGEREPESLLELSSTAPYITLHNTTEEDGDAGRESTLLFKGEQSGGEETLLAKIQASHEGTSDDEQGDLLFCTNDGDDGTALAVRMKIDSQGNVGIGEVAPESLLELSSTAPNITLHNTTEEDADAGRASTILFKGEQSGGEETVLVKIEGSHYATSDDERANLIFYVNDGNDGTSPTEKMRITPFGYVGIGTDVPNSTLDVDGQVRVGTGGLLFMIINEAKIDTGGGGWPILIGGANAAYTDIGNSVLRVNKSGNVGINDITPDATLDIASSVTTNVVLIVQGMAAQSADLFNVLNSDSDELVVVEATGKAVFRNSVDSTTGFQIFDDDGGTPIVDVDTTNERVGVGTDTPDNSLQVVGNSKFGDDNTNYATFATDGELTLVGTARVKLEDTIFATNAIKGASAPTNVAIQIGTTATMLESVLSFSKTTQNDSYWTYHVPEDNDDTVDLEFHLMWKPGSGWGSGTYTWGVEYIVKEEHGEDSTAGASTIISETVTPANATDFIETEFTATIDANAQQTISFHAFRDIADTADDVGLIRFYEIERTINRLGEPL